jgi:hypothetical protein
VVSSMQAGTLEVPRTRTWWPFDHPPGGTCVPDCRSYGRCHCGCGESPTWSPATVEDAGRIRGRPYTFRCGHQARVLLNAGGGAWSKHGIPVGQVRPLLKWLHERHGSWDQVAILLRIPMSTIKGYANNAQRRRVPPEAARRIQQLVLAHRKRSVLDQWESEPGMRPVIVLWPAKPRSSNHR